MAKSGDKYILREFNIKDYKEYSSWFKNPPKVEDLPRTGVVSGDMKAAGFLYNTDSTFCIIAFWHANPKNTNRETYNSLKEVIIGLCHIAKIYGKKNVFITTNKRGMIHLLKRLGFYNDDGHLILRVGND